MSKREAIKLANSRPRNKDLQWYVIKHGTGYSIASTSYIKRNPNVKWVYKTEGEKLSFIESLKYKQD